LPFNRPITEFRLPVTHARPTRRDTASFHMPFDLYPMHWNDALVIVDFSDKLKTGILSYNMYLSECDHR